MHAHLLSPTHYLLRSPGHSSVLFGPPPLFLHMCIKHAGVLKREVMKSRNLTLESRAFG